MATIAAREQVEPQALSAAGWRALAASFLGWLFDGYENYALILVAAVALRQLLQPDQLASLPIYIGGLLAVTLVGWATGGIIAGVLADYIGRKLADRQSWRGERGGVHHRARLYPGRHRDAVRGAGDEGASLARVAPPTVFG